MALLGTEPMLAKQISAMIQAELAKIGAPPPATALQNIDALAMGIAMAIIPHILSFAQVAPGSIITAGSPASQVSISPGVIV